MRINFKKVRYKNFLSTGNVFTEIDLDRHTTTLISGTNGSGKSSLLDAIIFSLFGKPHRKINKPQLLNSINQKDLLVEIEFTIGENEFLVRRGIRPGIFEVYKNNQLVDQDSATRDYQTYLEQEILGINHKSFNQIVVLGSATYVPFMELSAGARREIIEDLLDIQVFSTMNVLLKDRISQNKEHITDNSYKKDILQSKIESAKEHNDSIKKLREIEVNKIREKMSEHINNIENLKSKIETIQDIIAVLLSDIEDKNSVKAKLEKAKSLQRDLETNLKNHKKDLTFYRDHDDCPTCKQGIDHDFKALIITSKDEKVLELEAGLSDLSLKIKEYNDRIESISAIEDQIASANLKIGDHRATMRVSKSSLLSYKNELVAAEKEVEEVDTSKLEEYISDLEKINLMQQKLFNDKDVMSVVATMLKDGGIKTRIIRQYIPVMNKLINKYLSAFDLFVDFHLDENFNEVIKSRFRDAFSYASFSEGEKLRITLSIMLSWRAVAKLRNSVSTNLLLLDETLDGALDGMGIENLIETLRSLNNNDNIFIISHRGSVFQDKFDSHIRFEKYKNFSQIATNC